MAIGQVGTTQAVTLAGSGGLSPSAGAITAAVANTPGSAVTATTSAQVVANIATAGNITFHLVATAFVGTVIFENSIDGGLNYAPVISIREDGTGADSSVAINTAVAYIRMYTTALAGMTYFRVRCSSYTSGTLAVLMQPGPFLIEPNPTLAAGTANVGNVGVTSPTAGALGIYGQLNPYGTMRVTVEPTTLFMDPFDGGAIDTNRWTVSGTQAPTQVNGALTLAPTVGASVSNNALAVSVPTFLSPGVGFLTFSNVTTLEAAQTNAVNVHRFWGKGQVTSFAYATPITDGVGFEVEGTTGALQCVVYIAGTKYVINSTTPSQISSSIAGAGGSGTALPTGAVGTNYGKALTWLGGTHRYAQMIRSDVIYWFAEGTDVPVAALSYATPNVQTLPLRVHSITNPAGTSVANTFSVGGTAVNDNTAQNHTISDATYQWRRAAVDVTGNQIVKQATSATGTITSSTVTTTTSVVLAASALRLGATIYNSGTIPVYLALAGTATTTLFTALLQPGAYYELPPGITYTGAISAITSSGSSTLAITSLAA